MSQLALQLIRENIEKHQRGEDARRLDNSQLSIAQSVEQVLNWWQEAQPFKSS